MPHETRISFLIINRNATENAHCIAYRKVSGSYILTMQSIHHGEHLMMNIYNAEHNPQTLSPTQYHRKRTRGSEEGAQTHPPTDIYSHNPTCTYHEIRVRCYMTCLHTKLHSLGAQWIVVLYRDTEKHYIRYPVRRYA